MCGSRGPSWPGGPGTSRTRSTGRATSGTAPRWRGPASTSTWSRAGTTCSRCAEPRRWLARVYTTKVRSNGTRPRGRLTSAVVSRAREEAMPLPTRRSARPTAPSSTLVALAACRGKKEEPKAPAVPEVSVAEVIQRDVPIGGELTGQMRGFEDIEIRARVEGYLKSVDYREGTEVKKGQLLFTIDDQPYRAKLAEAKGELARAQSSLSKATLDVNRFKPLAEKRAISQAELDNAFAAQRSARAQVDAAKANVEKTTLDVGYTRLVSPIDGLAGQAQRKVGDLVGKGEPTLLTTVSSIDPIRVSVNIPESLYLRYASELGDQAPAEPTADRPGAELVLGDGTIYPERGRIVL